MAITFVLLNVLLQVRIKHTHTHTHTQTHTHTHTHEHTHTHTTDPELPYCQIMGKYRMTLNNYNEFAPYPHMRQTCGGHAPDYTKKTGC